MSHYIQSTPGNVTFGHKEAIILLGSAGSDQIRIDLNYYDCNHIILGTYEDPSISFVLRIAPKFYRACGLDVLSAQLMAMALGPHAARANPIKKARLKSIDEVHAKVASNCFVYRVTLSDIGMLSRVRSLLSSSAKMPSTLSMHTTILFPPETLGRSRERLDIELTDTYRFGAKPFTLRYQLDRLARNGALPPLKVLKLLPKVNQLLKDHGLDATLAALRQFYRQVPPPGPDIEAAELSTQALRRKLEEYATSYDQYSPENPY